MSAVCHICGRELPNKWAVARRETVNGEERFYCHLHAGKPAPDNEEGGNVQAKEYATLAAREEELAAKASGELGRRAWSECASLAGKLGGCAKAIWAKIHPDRSPGAMLAVLNDDMKGNTERLGAVKRELDAAYREIVARKREYQSSAPARQRLLKVELETLMARYRALEREFSILNENARSIETVKGRFLEVLAYGLRGKLDANMVDRLADSVDNCADEAEDLQDSLGDLERSGKRRERESGDFEAELAAFDGELGLGDDFNQESTNKEQTNANIEGDNAGAVRAGGIAEPECGLA